MKLPINKSDSNLLEEALAEKYEMDG